MLAKFNLILAIVATLVFCFFAWVSLPENIAYRAERREVSLYQYQQTAAVMSTIKIFFIGGLAVVVVGGLAVGVRVLYVRLGDRRYLAHLAQLNATQAMTIAYYDANRSHPSALGTVNYSPHITHHASKPAAQIEPLATTGNTSSTALPSFQDVLKMSNNDLILGFDAEGDALRGGLNDLYSFGVGGLSGSGKTSTAVFLLAQACALGARLVVVDPHGGAESLAAKLSPLSDYMLTKPASDSSDILAALDFVEDIFNRRKLGQPVQYPVIFVADEFLALMRNSDVAAKMQALGEILSQESRKYSIYGAFCSQKWTISKAGDMRDTLTSHLVHRTRPELARMQTGLRGNELPSDLMSLETGSYYLLDNHGDVTKLRVPNHCQTTAKPLPTDPHKARIIEMFRAGSDVTDIVKTVYGAKNGRAYTDALSSVNAILRSSLVILLFMYIDLVRLL